MRERIVSVQNEQIKNVCKLSAKARERKEQGLFIIEGVRELSLALSSGYTFEAIYVCPALFEKNDSPAIIQAFPDTIVCEVSEPVFRKMAYRENSGGVLAVAKSRSHFLSDIHLSENPFLIIVESVEKPGNLGAILRTADASKTDAVIVCDPLTDVYNPNVIRSSIGCVFTVPIAVCTNEEAFSFLKTNHIQSFAAELTAIQRYQEADFTSPSAIILGTEADGLTDFWISHADLRIKIPMRGVIDSLNVSVSTAILAFEALRQRGF
ncbi:MAG: RNA methyltransferase [Candidatus Azobacteroides sp.]|nr:RNA methyltransferase [Candidatus Azobacteroides sp.]